jgi:hypothetical protein
VQRFSPFAGFEEIRAIDAAGSFLFCISGEKIFIF